MPFWTTVSPHDAFAAPLERSAIPFPLWQPEARQHERDEDDASDVILSCVSDRCRLPKGTFGTKHAMVLQIVVCYCRSNLLSVSIRCDFSYEIAVANYYCAAHYHRRRDLLSIAVLVQRGK